MISSTPRKDITTKGVDEVPPIPVVEAEPQITKMMERREIEDGEIPSIILQQLNGSHLHTYKAIFQHPISHNLKWLDVRALLAQVCEIEDESNGNLKATRNGQVLVLHPPRHKDFADMDDVMKVRHFLQHSEKPVTLEETSKLRCILVVETQESRFFPSEVSGSLPVIIKPPDPADLLHQSPDSVQLSHGKEQHIPESYFKRISKPLEPFDEILIFGSGTQDESEMTQFFDWMKTHQYELAKKIVARLSIDGSQTDDQLLEKAREHFASTAVAVKSS